VQAALNETKTGKQACVWRYARIEFVALSAAHLRDASEAGVQMIHNS